MTRVIVGAEICLTVCFALVSGLLVWRAFEPPAWASSTQIAAPARPAGSQLPAVLTEIDPFHRAGAAASKDAKASSRVPETMLDLQLFGIRAGVDGGPGSAIIATPDKSQNVFIVGQEIIPGVRLEQVLPSRVVIRRNGVPESLSFDRETAAPQAVGGGPVIAPPALAGSTHRLDFDTMRSLAMQLRFSPAGRSGSSGLLLEGSADASVLQQTGLEAGDLLLSVNGTPVNDAAALASLAAAGAQGLTLEVERKGQRKFHRLELDRVQ